jgi:hypothetical protein
MSMPLRNGSPVANPLNDAPTLDWLFQDDEKRDLRQSHLISEPVHQRLGAVMEMTLKRRNFDADLMKDIRDLLLRSSSFCDRAIKRRRLDEVATDHQIEANEAVVAADDRFQQWRARILMAPPAVALVGIGSIAGGPIFEQDPGTAVPTVAAFMLSSTAGFGAAALRYRRSDLLSQRERWTAKLLSHVKSHETNLQGPKDMVGLLNSLKDEYQRIRNAHGSDNKTVAANQFELAVRYFSGSAVSLCEQIANRLEAIQIGSKLWFELDTVNRDLQSLSRWENIAFAVSLGLLVLGLLNPLWVLAFGPIFELSLPLFGP